MLFQKVKIYYERFETHISSIALVFGFIFDNLTFRDASLSSQNIVFVVYIFLSGFLIFLLNFLETKFSFKGWYQSTHFFCVTFLQFIFGNLFSSFLVFYSRGISIETSWPFLLLIVFILIGNEIFKKHYIKLALQISTFFFAVYSFFIYFIPVLFHQISEWIFIFSSFVSLIFIFLFIKLISYFAKENVLRAKKILIYSICGIVFVVNALYFSNSIPPVPIALKHADIYHNFVFNKGNYSGYKEKGSFFDFLKTYTTFSRFNNEPIFVMTSVFAPTFFNTRVLHEWQYYDEKQEKWITSSKISIPIVGGRDAGYKGYSLKQNIFPGFWRINILTTNGKFIGRVKIKIENVDQKSEVIYVSN